MRALLRSTFKSVHVSSLFIREYLDFFENLLFLYDRELSVSGEL